MNYRHSYHAGNFADVAKHLAEVAILTHLAKKDAPFAVIDSHAGRGLYDLGSDEARKTGEAEAGIERIRNLPASALSGSALLERYLKLAAEGGAQSYPGSPLIAARMLRPQDRLIAIEKHPEEAALLTQALARRGLILIDPPFEAPDEFEVAARTVRAAVRKFATGIYLIWYPIKSAAAGNAFAGEVLASGAKKALRIEIAIDAADGKLGRAGLLVLNPPYGFDDELQAALAIATPRLGARTKLDWLASEA